MALDDSALGRFQNVDATSASEIDTNTLFYRTRSDSSSSGPSNTSPPLPEPSAHIPQDEHDETPHTAEPTHDDEDELASTVSGMSDFASLNNDNEQTSELEHLKISATGPELDYRYIRSSDTYGRAPFSRPHFVSNSTDPPFSRPHTRISIPFGTDFGKYMHIPRALRATELGLAELAIFWLWSGLRRREGTGKTTTTKTTTNHGPVISPALLAHHKTGPPAAPYPMTQSTFPAFVGPRTCILNTGAVLNGWLLQIPRYLSDKEIAVAEKKLRQITDKISPWSLDVDPSCRLGMKRSEGEEKGLMGVLEEQKKDMMLLKDVVGLDFAAQDGKDGTSSVPIWVRRDVGDGGVETPRRRMMLPTPPTSGEKRVSSTFALRNLRNMHASSPSPSPSEEDLVTKAKAVTMYAGLTRAACDVDKSFHAAAHIRAWRLDVAASSGHSDDRSSEYSSSKGRTDRVVPKTSQGKRETAAPVQGDQNAHSTACNQSILTAEKGLTLESISTPPTCDIVLVTLCVFLLCWLILTEFI